MMGRYVIVQVPRIDTVCVDTLGDKDYLFEIDEAGLLVGYETDRRGRRKTDTKHVYGVAVASLDGKKGVWKTCEEMDKNVRELADTIAKMIREKAAEYAEAKLPTFNETKTF